MKNCPKCKENFNPSKFDRHRFCLKCRTWTEKRRYQKECPECGVLMQRKSHLCVSCHRKKKNYLFTGHTYLTKDGYKVINWKYNPSSDKSGKLFEHRYVMEKYLGRQLTEFENIHHKNGIRSDNRIENLELWIKPQPTGIKVEDAIIWAKKILELYGGYGVAVTQ